MYRAKKPGTRKDLELLVSALLKTYKYVFFGLLIRSFEVTVITVMKFLVARLITLKGKWTSHSPSCFITGLF